MQPDIILNTRSEIPPHSLRYRQNVIRKAVQGYDVKRADILTFAGAIIIVVIIAVTSQGIDSIPGIGTNPGYSQPDSPYKSPAGELPFYTMQGKPQVWNIPKNTNLNTIYVSGAGGYPVTDFPADMTHFGASDPENTEIWRQGEIVRFAQYTGPGNGFSETFHIPFGFWRINASMTAVTKPESSRLTWVLVDAETGTILTGNQMRYKEHVLKTVQASGQAFYFIVSAQDVNGYAFTLETTKAQYGEARIQPPIRRLTAFLNTA